MSSHDEHDHVIDLMSNKNSFYKFLYNIFKKKFEALKRYIRDNLTLNRIRYSIVDTNASIFFILKKNKKLQLCVNYKNFNVVIIKNQISLILLTRRWMILSMSRTSLNLISKIFIIKYEFAKKTSEKRRFAHDTNCSNTQWCFLNWQIVFATFQTLINKILSDLIDVICVIYLNNILIYFERQEKYNFKTIS